jgi:uncharacterized small protein (DUF1192 family)
MWEVTVNLEDLEPRDQKVDPFQENLDDYSLDELAERIGFLKQEIARCEALIAAKTSSRASAEAVFK